MRQKNNVEGTKIAQAAKDLNVTSVTIRRYLTEFNIATTSDDNGIKVLPPQAMEELHEVRRLKEEGNTNPKVMEHLEELRAKSSPGKTDKGRIKGKQKSADESYEEVELPVAETDEETSAPSALRKGSVPKKPVRRVPKEESVDDDQPQVGEVDSPETASDVPQSESDETRAKHSLTCQTCGKVFEHMNPRLRDCLDCYRTKRKERRRGGSDRHKNVIQHPLAQQVVNKGVQQQQRAERELAVTQTSALANNIQQPPVVKEPYVASVVSVQPVVQKTAVRNYRKAIEETRQITGSLKRRLERPDLPEGERRWLEQIYAYQLILHQGWRHLSEYKAATQQQGKTDL
jgi:DNA-binding transcriptional MerR regulator